jgi:hAT family C-terminal dimerisation region
VENNTVSLDEGVQRQPGKRDPVSFWKVREQTMLKVCAKIIFSFPVSFTGTERVLSEAGTLLTKQRKSMLPNIVKKLV